MDKFLKDRSVIKGECLVWTGRLGARGYGQTKVYVAEKRKQMSRYTHRLAYETWVGPILEGLTIDHTCFNKRCIRPEHLEAVTLEENNRRWIIKERAENTTFACGHERFGENRKCTGTMRKGKLNPRMVKKYSCRICNDAYMKNYQKEYQPKYHERKRNAATNNLH